MEASGKATPTIRLKSVALPVEHGGWAFLFEPVLLGLLLAPSWAGLWLGISALGVFLLYQPLKLAVKDRMRGKRYPRTMWAERFVTLYGLIAAVGLVLAFLTTSAPFWQPVLAVIPLAIIQITYGLNNQSRSIISEIAGALALSAVAPAIVIAGGWPPVQAYVLWIIPMIRAVTSILYIRTRLRLERGEPVKTTAAIAAHTIGLLILVLMVVAGLLPWPVVIGMAILWGRATIGLSSMRRPRQAKTLGFLEMGYGILVILITVAAIKLVVI